MFSYNQKEDNFPEELRRVASTYAPEREDPLMLVAAELYRVYRENGSCAIDHPHKSDGALRFSVYVGPR